MLRRLEDLAQSFWTATPVKLWIIFVLIGMTIELFIAAEKNQPWRNLWFNIKCSAIYLVVIFIVSPTLNMIVSWASQHFGAGWIRLDVFSDAYAQQAAAAAFYFVIVDFFYYWYHRSQHQFDWLWQQHALHHSEESLNASTATRHHWLEYIFQTFVIVLPMTLLFKLTPINVWIISMVGAAWTWIIHLNARILSGPRHVSS
jgi:sterol desaturase/sphingolipid hydroxylase (fatty acid hydroxylase superfamily)